VGLRQWVEESWGIEVFGDWVEVVKMGLVEFRWWLVLVRLMTGEDGVQQGEWWMRQPSEHEPSRLWPGQSFSMNPLLILQTKE